jgi:hypothetical protein
MKFGRQVMSLRGPQCDNFKSYIFNHFKMADVKLLRWMHYLHHSALLNNGLGLFSIVGFTWLHHIPSLANFATETKVCTFEVDTIPATIQPCSTVSWDCSALLLFPWLNHMQSAGFRYKASINIF